MTEFVSPTAEIETELRDHWGSGGVFELELTAGQALSGWTIELDFAGDIIDIWNARIVSHTGERYVIEAETYNRDLAAGAETEIGWVSIGAATIVTPLSINGDTFVIDDDDMDDDHIDHDDNDHSGHDDDEGAHNHADEHGSGGYTDITEFGIHHGTSSHTHHDDLLDGRTPITTEAMVAYTALRAYFGFEAVEMETVGQWAFDNNLTNNSQAWGGDIYGVGLYYAMQGAKVGWIRDDAYDPQLIADIQREARLGDPAVVMAMVAENGHEGFADFLATHGLEEAFLNTLKMEPHYGGWMHGRVHGWLNLPNGAIAHDVNHLTVLSHDQTQPFMNDTFDWPQWPALDVPDQDVIDYFQSMVVLGDPLGDAIPLAMAPNPITPDVDLLMQPDDDLDDQDEGERHSGDADDNRMVGGRGDDMMNGGRGDDTLIGRAGDDTLKGGAGGDQLNGGRGDDKLIGRGGDDALKGGGGADRLLGSRGDDTIKGGGGADVIIAGAGDDELYGGGGPDRFVFAANQGENSIGDFQVGVDKLRLKGVADLDALEISEDDGGAVITYRGTKIELEDVSARNIDEEDFLF